MFDLIAHITEQEVPSFWLVGLVGFVTGVAVTLGVMIRKLK
jgi:hypothetical protein